MQRLDFQCGVVFGFAFVFACLVDQCQQKLWAEPMPTKNYSNEISMTTSEQQSQFQLTFADSDPNLSKP